MRLLEETFQKLPPTCDATADGKFRLYLSSKLSSGQFTDIDAYRFIPNPFSDRFSVAPLTFVASTRGISNIRMVASAVALPDHPQSGITNPVSPPSSSAKFPSSNDRFGGGKRSRSQDSREEGSETVYGAPSPKRTRLSPDAQVNGKTNGKVLHEDDAGPLRQDTKESTEVGHAHAERVTDKVTQHLSRHNAQPDRESLISPTEPPNSATSAPSDASTKRKRPDAALEEERRRNKRLFGGLLSTLQRPTNNRPSRLNTQRSGAKPDINSPSSARTTPSSAHPPNDATVLQARADIDRKQQEKLAKQAEEADELERQRAATLLEKRIRQQQAWDREGQRLRWRNERAEASFLRTESGPSLFYRPYKLLPEQEDRIERQIDDVEERVDREREDLGEESRAAREPEQIGIRQDAHPHNVPDNVEMDIEDEGKAERQEAGKQRQGSKSPPGPEKEEESSRAEPAHEPAHSEQISGANQTPAETFGTDTDDRGGDITFEKPADGPTLSREEGNDPHSDGIADTVEHRSGAADETSKDVEMGADLQKDDEGDEVVEEAGEDAVIY